MAIPKYRSPYDVRREANKRSNKIFASYNMLHETLERHEAAIQKRWTKKTRPQRLKILLEAWPGMPTVHRPDFGAFRRESEHTPWIGWSPGPYFSTLQWTSTPGEVTWNDFLHAMASTGFAAEKLYGPVWQFSPTNLDINRSIWFHEPHPHGKIPFTVARRHGRTLNRAYGWFGDMFVLREK